ncbi:MAG TPA: DinB family protein [Bryobacteraceae bacterium]|nr:DinB family protein [Bryobacteraceae bacterium]
MEPLQPEQASILLQTLLPSLEFEHGLTKKILEALPADKGDFRPDPIAKTAMDLAAHVAIAECRFLSGVATGVFDFAMKRPESMKTTADVACWYSDAFGENLALIKTRTPEQLAQTLDFAGIFKAPAVTFLMVTMHHSIHHRGQLSVYLRPMGARVPSMYGESYDDAEARKAVQGR